MISYINQLISNPNRYRLPPSPFGEQGNTPPPLNNRNISRVFSLNRIDSPVADEQTARLSLKGITRQSSEGPENKLSLSPTLGE